VSIFRTFPSLSLGNIAFPGFVFIWSGKKVFYDQELLLLLLKKKK